MLGSEHSDIRILILSDQHRATASAIGKGQRDLRRMVNHMAVGQDQSIGSKNETGARPLAARPIAPGCALNIDLYQRAAHSLDRLGYRARVVIQQIRIVESV